MKANRHVVILSVLLAVSLFLNVGMYGAVRMSLGEVQRATYTRQGARVHPGEHAEPIVAKLLDGTPTTIAGADPSRPTLLYVFSPQCHWCAKNLPAVRALQSAADQGRIRLIGLSLDRKDLASYVTTNGWKFSVLMEPTTQTTRDYSLGATPLTFLINSSGSVEAVWQGAYSQSVCDEIEKRLAIRVPAIGG